MTRTELFFLISNIIVSICLSLFGMLFCGIINSSAQEKDTLTLRNEVSFGIGASSAFGTLVRAVSLGDHSLVLKYMANIYIM